MNSQDYIILQHLCKVWEAKRWDRDFYFSEMFDKILALLLKRAESNGYKLQRDGSPVYRALFAPVGLSVENVALVAALFSPVHLTLAFSEKTYSAHASYFHAIRNKLSSFCGNISEIRSLSGSDQSQMERRIHEWALDMKDRYGFSRDEMAIDLTGGTKLMSIGAQTAAVSLGIPAFYLNVDYDQRTRLPIPGTEELCNMRQPHTERGLAFVIMPFKSEYNIVYTQIQDAARMAGMNCTRVDKEIFVGGIMDEIIKMLSRAEIVIADLSDKNLNVFYELGLAHAWSKPTIMMTNNLQDVPFDLRHLRFIRYGLANPGDIGDRLCEEIKNLRS